MKTLGLGLAAALATAALGVPLAASAQDAHHDGIRHEQMDRSDNMRRDGMNRDGVRHADMGRDEVKRHSGWRNHPRHRVCRTVWRHHHRTRVCKWVRR